MSRFLASDWLSKATFFEQSNWCVFEVRKEKSLLDEGTRLQYCLNNVLMETLDGDLCASLLFLRLERLTLSILLQRFTKIQFVCL